MKYLLAVILVVALTCVALFAVQGSKEMKSNRVIGLHILKPRTEAQAKELEKRIKEKLIPSFKDVPGVISVNMIKALWERPHIGAMIVFENQEALENWRNSLPDEEKEEQKKAVEQYKEIAIIHQDFSIIPNEK
jgi:heme-degrading monooxygenase HmoA